MAEETEAVVRTAPLPGGVYRVAPEEIIPERGMVGYIRDKVIGAAQGAIDIASSPASVLRDVSTPDDRPGYQAIQEGASDLKRSLSGWKTPYGQGQEEGKVPADTSVLGTVLDAAPAAAAIYASGPFAPVTGGVIAHGILSNEQWDILRRMPEEELKKNEKYQAYRDSGMDHLDAIREIYKDRNTLESLITNVGSNALMAGIGQRLMTGVGTSVLRTEAGSMAARIIKQATMGTVEGGVAGAALGGGTEWGRQAAEIGMGLRKERDWGRIEEAAIPTAENLAILGGITGGARGFAQPRPPSVVKKVLGKTGEVVDDVGYTPSADEIGTDLRIVTGIELSGARPPAAGRGPLEVRPPAEARPGAEVRPPEVRPPEVRPPVVEPTEVTRPGTAAEVPSVVAPTEPVRAAAPVEPVAGRAAAPPVEAPITEAARPVEEAPPVAAAEAAAPKMTVEELRARALDLDQSPTFGDLQQHVAKWQEDNPGVSLGAERNEIFKANRVAREARDAQVRTEKLKAAKAAREETARVAAEAKATAAAEREAARTAAAEAKAQAAAEKAAAKANKAEQIKQQVADAKAAREAAAEAKRAPITGEPPKAEPTKTEEPAPAVEPKPAVEPPPLDVEPVALGGEPAKPVAPVTPPSKPVPVTGEAAKAAIEKAALAKKERLQTEARTAEQNAELVALRREKATDRQGEYREVKKTEREVLAKNTLASKADAMDQVIPLAEKIAAGRPSQVKADLETVGRHLAGVVDAYRAQQREAGLPVIGKFGSTKTRAGHGDHYSVMSDLNNISNEIARHLEKDGPKAKAAALEGIELLKKIREGKVGEHMAAKRAENEVVATTFKSRTLGEKAGDVRDKAAEARAEEREAEVHDITEHDIGKGSLEDHMYPTETLDHNKAYVDGKAAERDADKVDGLRYALDQASRIAGGEKLNDREAAKIFEENGEVIKKGKVSDVLAKYRPDEPILRSIFDAVYDVVKDMPLEIWSRDALEAYSSHKRPDLGGSPLGMYSVDTGRLVLRTDTVTPLVVFHEAIHAATSRAMIGSERLTALVNKLQDIIEDRFKHDIDVTAEKPFQVAIRNDRGERINPREFIAELFSRPEVADLVKMVNLTRDEVKEIKALGYRADVGKNILKSLWDGFLKTIGFAPKGEASGFKVAVDMLQDMFEREMSIRETDAAVGRPTGSFFGEYDMLDLAKQDPEGGPAIVKAWKAQDFPAVTEGLINSAHKFNEATLDKSIKFLTAYNKDLYGHEDYMVDPAHVTPMSNTEQVKGGVEKFLSGRFGDTSKMADLGYQIDNKFKTPLRHLVQGLRYTQDLGNNLEQGFRDAIQPMKDAMSRREHFAQEYMDKSGANKLIDNIATLKNAIKDRGLWTDFEKLLVRESYTRAFADEELGVGRNAHINTGDLRDYQSAQDHKANRDAFEAIRKRDPEGRLVKLRNEIHDFEAKDLEARKRAQATDMLTRMKIVDPTADSVGLMALIKDVREHNSSMTTAERAAFDRIVGKDHTSKGFKDYLENRKVIRSLLDQTDKNGPHVPFMRHGDHVVTANYHVRPEPGVKFHEIDPTAKVKQGYDFENLADAQNFVKNTLSREDVQITQTGGREVVYDTRTGEQAKIYTVEKKDGSARTFENLHDAETAMEKGDEIKVREVTPKDVEQQADNNLPVGHYKIYNRVEFNPREYVRFDSERAANEYRNRINQEDQYAQSPGQRGQEPTFRVDVSNVESMRDISARGVAAHASSEMTQWINRVEASPAYQKMSKEAQADWKRELQAEAARVTMMTGRRSINLPREYVKGASTDILKNMIQSTGASARAISGNLYNPRIALAREQAQAYTDHFQYQTGGEGRSHRARQDVLDEFDRRTHAQVKVDGSWAQGIKRALQVSMISHLADASYLVINAMEPWIFGSAITAARHGWYGAYSELAKANALVNPLKMAAEAGKEIGAAIKGEYRPANYEQMLLQAVSGAKDAKGLTKLLHHMFDRGLTARDTGMEVARIHDPSGNVLARGADWLDNVFRGGNTGVETLNRSTMGIANFRLEFRRAIKEGKTEAQAEVQAIRYAEDHVFKAAGDYGTWNNPRYFNNPFLKLATQFKKYPLRIASVYADALIQATRGDKQAMKQVAYMLASQGIAAGALGLPIGAFAGTVNAAYILGLSDDKWDDKEFAIRKWMVDRGMSAEATDLVLRGALRWTGADFHPRLSQSNMVFFGSPDSRKPQDLLGVGGRTLLGAPGDWGAKALKGFQQLVEAAGDYHAGAHEQAYQKGMAGVDGIIQIKALHNIVKAVQMANQGPSGMPKGNEATTGQAVMQGIGFGPTQIARKQEEKRVIQAAKKEESLARNTWVNRWVEAGKSSQSSQSAVWDNIQKNYNPTVPTEQRIKYSDLWKAKTRKEKTERRDDTKLGVTLSGRQKSFSDIGRYFSTN